MSTSGMFDMQEGYPFWPTLGTVGTWCSNSVASGRANFCGNGNAFTYGSGNFTLRPNLVQGVNLKNPNWRKDPFNQSGIVDGTHGYVNPTAFAMPGTCGTFNGTSVSANTPALGNSSRSLGLIRSPNTLYFNMSGTKNFILKDGKVNLNIRVDATNVMNHTNFFLDPNSQRNLFTGILTVNNLPEPTPNATFGALSAANNTPRRTFGLGVSLTF